MPSKGMLKATSERTGVALNVEVLGRITKRNIVEKARRLFVVCTCNSDIESVRL